MTEIRVAERSDGLDRHRWWRSRRFRIVDRSMEPSLCPGDRVLVDPKAFEERPPRPGEIVVADDPEAPGRWLVKRVRGVGPIEIRVPVEGLDRPSEWPSLALPDGTVYLISDHPSGRDSRRFGPVPLRALRGLVWYRTGPQGVRGSLEGR